MYGYSKPIIKESFNPDRTKLIIFLDKMRIPKINNMKSYNNKLDLLSSDEEKTLEYIKIKNEIDRKELIKKILMLLKRIKYSSEHFTIITLINIILKYYLSSI